MGVSRWPSTHPGPFVQAAANPPPYPATAGSSRQRPAAAGSRGAGGESYRTTQTPHAKEEVPDSDEDDTWRSAFSNPSKSFRILKIPETILIVKHIDMAITRKKRVENYEQNKNVMCVNLDKRRARRLQCHKGRVSTV